MSSRGFTLLELVLAVAVFAVMSTVAYSGLRAVLVSDTLTRERAEMLAELQVTLAVLERDLLQIAPIEPRDRFGDRTPPLRFSPLASEPELELIRTGGGGTDRLRRVSWRATPAGLERRSWPIVDLGGEVEPFARVFFSRAADDPATTSSTAPTVEFSLRFVPRGDGNIETVDAWPPLVRGTGVRRGQLPALVEVVLWIPGLGQIERHLALPEGI